MTKPKTISKILATWFGLGLMPKAPGTCGSLGALPLWIALQALGGTPAILAGIVAVTVIGWWAAAEFEKTSGMHDSPKIVIDEVAGMGIALIAAHNHPLLVIAAFLLFRAFDILKPWPVSWCDRTLPGATGVMADDLAAGIYALNGVILLRYAGLS